MIRSTAPVDRHHSQKVHAVQMHHITAGVGELQFQQEDHLVRSFGVRGAAPCTCTTRHARPKSWAAFWRSSFAGPLLPPVSRQYSCLLHNVSVLLKSLRQGAIDTFCSTLTQRSRKSSSFATDSFTAQASSFMGECSLRNLMDTSDPGLSLSAVPSHCHFLISHLVSSLPAGCPRSANNLNIHEHPAACSCLRDRFRVSASKRTSLVGSH